jgi:putative SOS response-associated peptidase YedK
MEGKGRALINVRVETLKEKNTFSEHLSKRRVLIPASSFYEWSQQGKLRWPYRIYLATEPLFAFAGVFEIDQVKGQPVRSYSIITTEPNSLIKPLHDRMPAILRREDEQAWLDPVTSKAELFRILTPLPAERMNAYKVSTSVNSPLNDTTEVTEPFKE